MKTKKELEEDGWTFITLATGTISASKLIQEINGIPALFHLGHKARTMKTLRKRITNLYYR